MQHLMIDLETMGTRFDAPVLAVGAVYFNPETGALGEKFYVAIDIDDAFRHGKTSGSTVKWWMQQGDAARAAAVKGTASLADALTAFEKFCAKAGPDGPVAWGNGPTFDITILEYAFGRCLGRPAPWKFWNVRCCRTIKDLAAGLAYVPKVTSNAGTAHHALDDAVFQAGWVSEMWQVLRGKKTPAPPQKLVEDDLLG
jgi:hypothetical protein